MKRIVMLSIVLSILFFNFSSARIFYVSTNGNDNFSGLSESQAWQHVYKASNTLVSGDTVLIMPGVYAESTAWEGYDPFCNGASGINPKNSGVTFKGYDKNNKPIITGDKGYKYSKYGAVVKDNTTLEDLIIKFSFRGIYIDGQSNVKINSCVICSTAGPYLYGQGGDNSAGIMCGYFYVTKNITVENCSLFCNWSQYGTTFGHRDSVGDDFNNSGIHCYKAVNCTFTNNTIFNQPKGFGIRMKANDSTIVITNNTIHDCMQGIAIGAMGNNQIAKNNIIYNCKAGINIVIYRSNAKNMKVINNTISNIDGSGISLQETEVAGVCQNCSLYNNMSMNSSNDWGNGVLNISQNNHPGLYSDYNCFYDNNNFYPIWWHGSSKSLVEYQNVSNLDIHSVSYLPQTLPIIGKGKDGGDIGASLIIDTIIPEPQDTVPPIIFNVRVAPIYKRQAIISWTTNELSSTVIQWGRSKNYGQKKTINILTTMHSEIIGNLQPNTLYHYRIESIDSTGNYSYSKDKTFRTKS